ncbi:DNA cytosine methyltransferase [Vibrio aestuarianus]|uniref:DNA cytosine methyltransferase n=1 Tax=Vibrio aestuarianus TaxID=28171 RepID=UPI00237C8D52|nr:DNA cytosine methyltransferase [Vibrio aestuarianus]MDE1315458.1 DNA cytosine methyltransferase [Vibrio aestuarianus]
MNVVTLFSGCGGLDLSFHQLGFNILWANDFDPKACETYAHNIGNHVVCEDITKVDISTIPSADLILGGFPCQDFSMIWKREGIETERGNLYKNFVNIVSDKNPKMFVAENVKGLLTANKGQAIKTIIDDFSHTGDFGYNVTPHLVNFANYGAPQLRERVLLIGVRKDLNQDFKMPNKTHSPENYLSSGEALRGVKSVPFNNEHQNIQPRTVEKLKLIPEGGNFSDIPKDSEHYVKGMISHVYRRLHRDKPSTTIIAAGGGGTWGYHYEEPRPLTNRERARLFGYPDDFKFIGTITEVRRQIGNSVPPLGMYPIAKKIKAFLETL